MNIHDETFILVNMEREVLFPEAGIKLTLTKKPRISAEAFYSSRARFN